MNRKLVLGLLLLLLPISYSYADDSELTYKYAKCSSATHYYWNTFLNRERSKERTKDWLTISREFANLRQVSMIKVNPPYGLVAEGKGQESFYSSLKTLEQFAPQQLRIYVENEVKICMEEHAEVITERLSRY
ncbi:TPA: hypothetical protein RQL07_004510 [Vibrio vulnificus]|nr:hypothetical protein [Vibrio vulnificus]HDY8091190.1 hypothetical protein [Vibrio vulnificus]HDY8113851.1 hypothetical protein [Vibrio vulnificus]